MSKTRPGNLVGKGKCCTGRPKVYPPHCQPLHLIVQPFSARQAETLDHGRERHSIIRTASLCFAGKPRKAGRSLRQRQAMASRFLSGLRATTSWWDGVEWRPALHFVDTGLAGAGVKLAERVIKEAGSSCRKTKLTKVRAEAGR